MGILDKFNDASKGVSDKAKNISEANNLKRKILYEEERIVEIFTDIGKKYYKNPDEDPKTFKVLCDDIDTRRRRIKKMRFEPIRSEVIKSVLSATLRLMRDFSSADAVVQDSPTRRTRILLRLSLMITTLKAAETSLMLIPTILIQIRLFF